MSTTARLTQEVEVGGGKTKWKEEADGKRGPKMRAKKLG
jgi:hypothetical protein